MPPATAPVCRRRLFFFFLMTRPPPRSPLFPYTPLFRSDQCVALGLDERPEALAHRREPQQLGERVTVPRMLGAVAGQHARPDDLSGREALIVDRERLRVSHHLERRLAAGDEPAVQDRHPPDRPQRCENRMRIRLELLQRDLDRHSIDSARSVETSATRSSEPVSRTPSSSITVQKGHATARVSAPVSIASRARSTLICLPFSSIHMCAPPAPQQNVFLPLRFISIG